MKTKKPYLPKNIRQGYTIAQARAKVAELGGDLSAPFVVGVSSFANSHDTCGNGTARYQVTLETPTRCYITIVESGARREQVGYSGQNEAALYALDKLGFEIDLSGAGTDDYKGYAQYLIKNWSV